MAKADAAKTSDYLWKIIARFDVYMNATNSKAAIIGTFDSFVIGTIALKWQELLALYAGHPKTGIAAAACVLVIALAAVLSLVHVFLAINPFLKSSKKPGQYHSDLFFQHVAEHATAEDYLKALETNEDEDRRINDLCAQTHIMAKGLTGKFYRMQWAVGAILFAQLPAMAVLLVLHFCVLMAGMIAKVTP